MSGQYHKTGEESPENEIFAKGNNSIKSTPNTTKLKLDLYYVKTNSYMYFKSICRKMTKKSPKNEFLAKGNNSCKSRSNGIKVKLDLWHYVKTNLYVKFQVNTSKDDKEKSGKRNFSKGQ